MKKFALIFLIMVAGASFYFFKNTNTSQSALPALNPIRRMLCYLRGGDYVHPGDEHTIDLVMEQALCFDHTLTEKSVLDLGCGYGGTVNYLAKHGFEHAQGIDLDPATIAYAQKTYPKFKFSTGNALEAAKLFQPNYFSLVTMFSVVYAIEDKETLLNNIHKITAPNGIITILDYTHQNSSADEGLKDATHKRMHAIVPEKMRNLLEKTGWKVLQEQNLTHYFADSYTVTLNKLEEQKEALGQMFSPDVVAQVKTIYLTIQNRMESGDLGGILIIAQKNTEETAP